MYRRKLDRYEFKSGWAVFFAVIYTALSILIGLVLTDVTNESCIAAVFWASSAVLGVGLYHGYHWWIEMNNERVGEINRNFRDLFEEVEEMRPRIKSLEMHVREPEKEKNDEED